MLQDEHNMPEQDMIHSVYNGHKCDRVGKLSIVDHQQWNHYHPTVHGSEMGDLYPIISTVSVLIYCVYTCTPAWEQRKKSNSVGWVIPTSTVVPAGMFPLFPTCHTINTV